VTFANVHPFFVHAPLVLIPTAAAFLLIGRKVRTAGFSTATLLVTIAAAITALMATASGLVAEGTLRPDPALDVVLRQHKINGCIMPGIVTIAALLAIAETRGWLTPRAWWLRTALLLWATIGVVYIGHSGATMVFLHGAAVAR